MQGGTIPTHMCEGKKLCPFTLGNREKLSLVFIIFLCFESLKKGGKVLGENKRKFRRKFF
jgi:hypothetical protein